MQANGAETLRLACCLATERGLENLDAEHFEELFGRVMALIPPQELEAAIGGASGDDLEGSIGVEIERLVRQGYEIWSKFNEVYREQEERIRKLDPGAAD